ncbi:hypothetical protein FQZ97_1011900 [compost metagenome]
MTFCSPLSAAMLLPSTRMTVSTCALCEPVKTSVATPPATVRLLAFFRSKPFTPTASKSATHEPAVPLTAGTPDMVQLKFLTLVSTTDAI